MVQIMLMIFQITWKFCWRGCCSVWFVIKSSMFSHRKCWS